MHEPKTYEEAREDLEYMLEEWHLFDISECTEETYKAAVKALNIVIGLEEVIKTLKDHKYHHAAEIIKEALKND